MFINSPLRLDIISIAFPEIFSGRSIVSMFEYKNKLDNNYFHVISNENEEQILAFRARLLYQKLLDKGFRLVE